MTIRMLQCNMGLSKTGVHPNSCVSILINAMNSWMAGRYHHWTGQNDIGVRIKSIMLRLSMAPKTITTLVHGKLIRLGTISTGNWPSSCANLRALAVLWTPRLEHQRISATVIFFDYMNHVILIYIIDSQIIDIHNWHSCFFGNIVQICFLLLEPLIIDVSCVGNMYRMAPQNAVAPCVCVCVCTPL